MRQLKISQQITQRDEMSVNRYFQEINKYPLVSVEEEVELTLRIHKGDEQALKKLVEANLRFVVSVAKQYQNQGLSFADLINEGNVGLVKAASKFDETRGFKFISYAVWWIRQSIMQAILEQTRVVRLPLNRLTSINKITKAFSHLEQQFEREPTNGELAEYMEVAESLVAENNNFKRRQLSLDKTISNTGESDYTLYDLIQTENSPAPDDELLSDSTKINIVRVLEKLDAREAEVISLFYGLKNKEAKSLHEISSLMNISCERVRQIKSHSLKKMKRIITGKTWHLDID